MNAKVQYTRRTDLEPPASPIIWVEINAGTSSAWLLFVGYREWRSLYGKNKAESGSQKNQLLRLELWQDSWALAEKENKPIFSLSDINVDVQPWLNQNLVLSEYQHQQKPILNKVREMATATNLHLIPTVATRFQGRDKESILDILLTNSPQMVHHVELIPSSTDHKIVLFHKDIVMRKIHPETKLTRSFKNYTKEGMIANLNIPMLNSLYILLIQTL